MKKETFKKIIAFQFVLLPITFVKSVMYPYVFAPEEFSKAMVMYDQLQPLPSNFIFFLVIILLLGWIISLILLYRFNYYGRLIFLWITVFSFIFIFVSNYYVYDSLDAFLDSLGILFTGFTIGISYFSSISKKFKKKD